MTSRRLCDVGLFCTLLAGCLDYYGGPLGQQDADVNVDHPSMTGGKGGSQGTDAAAGPTDLAAPSDTGGGQSGVDTEKDSPQSQNPDAKASDVEAPVAASPDSASNEVPLVDTGLPRPCIQVHKTVHDISFSPDSKYIAIAPFGSDVMVLRAADGTTAMTLPHGERLNMSQFSPDGTRIASGSYRLQDTDTFFVKVWDARDGRLLWSVPNQGESGRWSPDGKLLAVGILANSGVDILDAATGKKLRKLVTTSHVVEVRFGVAGSLWTADDNVLEVWVPSDGTLVKTLQPNLLLNDPAYPTSDPFEGFDFSPAGDLVAMATHHQLEFRHQEDGSVVRSLPDYGAYVAFSPDAEMVITGRKATLIKVSSGAPLLELSTQETQSAAFSPDGRQVCTASLSGFSCWCLR